MRLGRRDFNVCFVTDQEIQRMNAAFRGNPRPTDVLSFPWVGEGSALARRVGKQSALPRLARGGLHENAEQTTNDRHLNSEFAAFLGDVVISVETARHHARAEGHSIQKEVHWLILHGLLHLLGYDHETDHGQMRTLERSLRNQLGI